jgi:hypothetical protein
MMKVIEMPEHNFPSFWQEVYLVPTRRVGMQCRTRCVPYFASSQAPAWEFSAGSSSFLSLAVGCYEAQRASTAFSRGAFVVIHKCLGDIVIPAGIAGIHDCKDAGGRAMHGAIAETPWMAMPKLATNLVTRSFLVIWSIHIPVLWFPAIPAGMTCFKRLVYNDEHGAWERG